MASMTAKAAYTNHTETHEAEVTAPAERAKYAALGLCPQHPDVGNQAAISTTATTALPSTHHLVLTH